MLTLSFNLKKMSRGYSVTLTADENGRVIHTDKMKSFTGKDILSVRKKTVNLGGKGITLALNVIGRPKVQKARRKNNKLNKSGKK